MRNRLTFSSGGPAARLYRSLDPDTRSSLDSALDYIRDVPYPHGEVITTRHMPPVTVYEYNDGTWKVSYGLGYDREQRIFHISVWAIRHLAGS